MAALDRCYNIADLRLMAEKRLPKGLFDFIDKGTEDMISLGNNRSAFAHIKLLNKVVTDISDVQLESEVLGKPASPRVAREVLRRLSGRRHRVLTGVALVRSDDRREAGGVETTHVEFREIRAAAIDRYVAGGSPLDKAGAYGIQDLDETWIAGIDGLHSNVVGLPVERLAGWISALEP